MKTMCSVQMDDARKALLSRSLPTPEIGDESVLGRVTASGIYRTDWHVWNGDWKSVAGSLGNPQSGYPELPAMIQNGRLSPRPHVDREVDFADGQSVLDQMSTFNANASSSLPTSSSAKPVRRNAPNGVTVHSI